MSPTQITVAALIGLVFIVLGWGIGALFIDRDVRRWQIAFLVRRVGLYGTALRAAGIRVPDDDEMPDRPPTWRERRRGRREPTAPEQPPAEGLQWLADTGSEPATTTVIEVVEPRQETPVTQPADTVPNLPAQKPRRPRPRPAPTVPDNVAVAAGTQAAEDAANDPFLVAYRAELDRQVAEWRAAMEERAK